MRLALKQHSVLPGFGLTLGYTLLYLSLIVLIPLSALFIRSSSLSWSQFWHTVTDPRVVASYRLTFGASLIGAALNAVFGFAVAWTLERWNRGLCFEPWVFEFRACFGFRASDFGF